MSDINELPYAKSPCGNCPFRKDSMKKWLGEDRAKEISKSESFVCHKNKNLQCAGHMVVCEDKNLFVRLARSFYKQTPPIKNKGVLFDSVKEFINHHKQ